MRTRYLSLIDFPLLYTLPKSFFPLSTSFFRIFQYKKTATGSLCRQNFSSSSSSSLENVSAVLGLHSLSEAVLFFPLPLFGLICHFHIFFSSSLYWCHGSQFQSMSISLNIIYIMKNTVNFFHAAFGAVKAIIFRGRSVAFINPNMLGRCENYAQLYPPPVDNFLFLLFLLCFSSTQACG